MAEKLDTSFLDEEEKLDTSFLDEPEELGTSLSDKPQKLDTSFLDEPADEPKDKPKTLDTSFLDEPEDDKDDLTLGQTAGSLAIDVGGSIGSQALGYSLAPFTLGGSLVIPFLGGMASSITAQLTAEDKDLNEISYGRALSSGLLNLIPGASVTKFSRPIAREALKGAAMGAGDATVQAIVDEKRLPTKEELAFSSGIGAGIGGAIAPILKSGAKKKFTQRVEEGDIFGMPIDKVDEAILTTTANGKELRDIVKKVTGREFGADEIEIRAKNLELDLIAQKKRNDNLPWKDGWFGVDGVFNTLTPTIALGPKIRNTVFETKNSVNRINNLAKKLPKGIQDAIETKGKDPEKVIFAKEKLGRDANAFLDGDEMSEELKKQPWAGNLAKYREEEDNLYKQFSKLLIARKKGGKIDDFFKGLDAGDEDFLIEKLHRAAFDGKSPSQYKALVGAKDKKGKEVFYPRPEKMDPKDYDRLFSEIKDWQVKNNPNLVNKSELAELKALRDNNELTDKDFKKFFTMDELVGSDGKSGKIKDHMTYLAKESEGSIKLRNMLPGNVERKLINHVPGVFERSLLGEVKDVGMRMKLGIDELGESLAKFDGDKRILSSLQEQGLVSKFPQGDFTKPLRLPNLNTGDNFYVQRETDRALAIINSSDVADEINDPILRTANDFLKSSVSASKAVKVILNFPSYAVNFLSGQITMAGMGLYNPYKGVSKFVKGFSDKSVYNAYTRGARLAVNESDLLNKAGNVLKKPTPQNRKAYLDLYDEYVRNGIMNGNIAAEDIMESLKGVSKDGLIGKTSKIYSSLFNFFGKLYSVTDIAARASVYEDNKMFLKRVFPQLGGAVNKIELERVAAAITNDTYQNYDYVSRIVRKLSRIGIMPQFVTFTAEFARNMYHQANLARRLAMGDVAGIAKKYGISKNGLRGVDVGSLRKEGAKRVASLTAIMSMATFVPTAINRSNGIDDEADNDLRKVLPSWQKNKSLVFFKDEKNPDQILAANVSYIAPHAIISSVIQAGLDGKDQTSVMGFLVDEFVGTGTFINQEMMRALDNRTGRGKQITYADSEERKALDLISYFISNTFMPGQVKEFEKLMDSINNSETARYTTEEVLKRQLGLRVNKYSLEEMTKYKLQDLMNSESKIKGEYSTAYKKFTGEYTGEVVSEEELEEIYQNSNEGSARAYDQMKDIFNAMTRSFGYSHDKAVEIISSPGSNVSTTNAFRIIKDLDHQDIDRVPGNTTEQRYNQLFGADTEISQFTDSQIRRQINSLRRTDPIEFKAMNNYYRSLKRSERSNLSTEDKLLKKMSIRDRAEAILSLGYDSHAKKMELRRKGIWTKDVELAIRAMR